MQTFFEQPFWGRGFRPFFFLGALYSVFSLGIWGWFYAGHITPPGFLLDSVLWHAHEMIYGYTMAIIAGFLLTAVANWTGGAPARQIHLISLCFLWLLGRLVMNVDLGLPFWGLVLAEIVFIPALALSLAVPLIKSWNKRNFIFLTLLSALFACDLVFLITMEKMSLYIALMVILTMISLVGGRIIPAFTVAALRRNGVKAFQTPQEKMDIAALVSLAAVALCLVFAKDTIFMALCAGLSALIHGLRMRHYHGLKTLADPMLWILQAGYLWLIIGLFMLSLTGFGILALPSVIHALTTGCIGSMTLGMICRVTLGHTGRNLLASKITTASFLMMQVAALMRVFGPLSMPNKMTEWVTGSAFLWAACFVIYLLVYTPMLTGPRPDGREA
ncbi:MAG: NnrS family protein [Rhodospirillales bacterium]|nr:NnrS family protein [Alphaproteobacteria bacterium]USO06461.1 MAG: NnrS family protein [Rhodospirillales bacterium]